MKGLRTPTVSILVCAFNMQRELPRTILTLSQEYQRDTSGISYEVVVLDNGSIPAVDVDELRRYVPTVRVIRPEICLPSPARAINAAMAHLQGQLLGLWIDGARMATPGIVTCAEEAWRADPSRAIGTVAFHLGPDVQMRSVLDGYDTALEDALLDSVPWRQNGYSLFEVGTLAGSSSSGWFGCISETNALFMDRRLWGVLGGLDERFQSAGGGYVNLDLWGRAVAASDKQPWIILGEGTFHQVHGGTATNGNDEARDAMRIEYEVIRGHSFQTPAYRPRFVGALNNTSFLAGSPRVLDNHRKVHTVRGRPFRVGLGANELARIQLGTFKTAYKGLRLAKNPFDLALYLKVIQGQRPKTIIEVGTSEGGSAAWLIDQCRALGLVETRLITIDRCPPQLELQGVDFYQGDSNAPDLTFPHEVLMAAPHPWLVIDDSAHTYRSVLALLLYFDGLLSIGDRIVIEDGVVADLDGANYRGFDDGPNTALADFLVRTGARYAIDVETCDFYGRNVTYAPNGWLVRRG